MRKRMKNIKENHWIKRRQTIWFSLSLFMLTNFLTIVAAAQDSLQEMDNSFKNNSGKFIASPWVWVVGGSMLVLLLVTFIRSSSNKGH